MAQDTTVINSGNSNAANSQAPGAGTSQPVVDASQLPKDAHPEHEGMHVNPMRVEAKHLFVGGLLGLVFGAIFGYLEENRQKSAQDLKYIGGFAALGLLLGIGLSMMLPARKKHHVKHADGSVRCYYSD